MYKRQVDPFTAAADTSAAPGPSGTAAEGSFASEQVVEALVGLGFQERTARPVVDALVAAEPGESASALLRRALSQLGKK